MIKPLKYKVNNDLFLLTNIEKHLPIKIKKCYIVNNITKGVNT